MTEVYVGLILVALFILWVIITQRKLVAIDELVGNALSQIGVQLNSRWNALKSLMELTKSYDEHEYKTLEGIASKRSEIGSKSSAMDVENQEKNFTQALSRLIALGEAYPELKSNSLYSKTMESVNLYENQVRRSRMVYNDTVTKLNRAVRQFPASLIAGLLGFRQKDYLETDVDKVDMPTMV